MKNQDDDGEDSLDDMDPDPPDFPPETCPACSGSGEGRYDGTKCQYCNGRGET
jgi:hypothetical protein